MVSFASSKESDTAMRLFHMNTHHLSVLRATWNMSFIGRYSSELSSLALSMNVLSAVVSVLMVCVIVI